MFFFKRMMDNYKEVDIAIDAFDPFIDGGRPASLAHYPSWWNKPRIRKEFIEDLVFDLAERGDRGLMEIIVVFSDQTIAAIANAAWDFERRGYNLDKQVENIASRIYCLFDDYGARALANPSRLAALCRDGEKLGFEFTGMVSSSVGMASFYKSYYSEGRSIGVTVIVDILGKFCFTGTEWGDMIELPNCKKFADVLAYIPEDSSLRIW